MSFNFKFTHSVLNRLEADGLTPAPLKNLQALRDISFANEEFLLTAVMETVSIKDAKSYFAYLLHRPLRAHLYRVTEYTLLNLEADGLPKTVLKRLEKALLSQPGKGLVKFAAELESCLGTGRTKKYLEAILQHARPPFLLPFYECRTGGKRFMVDVTLSVPSNREHPGVLDQVIGHLKREGVKTVCEVGAGRFRNVRKLIQEGFDTHVVEYQTRHLYDWLGDPDHKDDRKSYARLVLEPGDGGGANALDPLLRRMRESWRRELGPHFKTWITPRKFPQHRGGFDAIFLILVTHVIPYPGDRELLIQACAKNLNSGGFLFWLSPWWDNTMRKAIKRAVKFGKSEFGHLITKKGRKIFTYYDEFRANELDGLVAKYGFNYKRQFGVDKKFARLYHLE